MWFLVGEILNFNISRLSAFIWPHNGKTVPLNHTRTDNTDPSRFNSRDGKQAQNLSQKEGEKSGKEGLSVLQGNPR
jgi:hypothetical protein